MPQVSLLLSLGSRVKSYSHIYEHIMWVGTLEMLVTAAKLSLN
jgi:hypothetical protein